jgi:L-threonine synthase (EC 4.2.3.1)
MLILTATSGDTGKAALEGFKNLERFKVAVFFPNDGVSFIQERQMTTQEGNNTYVFRLMGNFDDAQREVKDLFSDAEFFRRAKENEFKAYIRKLDKYSKINSSSRLLYLHIFRNFK